MDASENWHPARTRHAGCGGSWLNLIEGFFSKFARSVLRHIRVTSKHELKERIMAGIEDVNHHPVIHTWYINSLRQPDMIRTKKTLT